MKYPTPSQAIDALIGEEEQNGKQKRTKRKKQGAGPHPATLDHSETFYDVKKGKGIEAQGAKHPTPSLATDALIGDEEQNKKRRKEQRERKQ